MSFAGSRIMNESRPDLDAVESIKGSDGSGSGVEVKIKYLGVIGAATMIATWNTTSTLMNFPYIFGQLGLIGGPFFTLLMQGLAFYVALRQIDLVIYYKDLGYTVDTFSDLGECLGGVWGRRFFMTIQMANQVGFLPYALNLTVGAIQRIFPGAEFLSCNGNTMVLVILLCYGLVQLSRDWKNFNWLAYVVWFLTVVQAGIFLSYAIGNRNTKTFGPEQRMLFFGQDYVVEPNCTIDTDVVQDCIPPSEFYTFNTFFSALGAIVFSFAPSFIVTELMSEMKTPEKDMKKSLTMAFSFSSILNEVMGLTFVGLLGNQVPMQVQELLPLNSFECILSQLIIILAMVLDFVISVLVINRQIVLHYYPNFDFAWTLKNSLTWAMVTFVPMTATFLLALFIPHFDSLITFVTAFSIPYANYVLVLAYSYHYLSKRGVSEVEIPMSSFRKGLHVVIIMIGLTVSVVKFYQFIVDLINLDFSGSYWCDQVAS